MRERIRKREIVINVFMLPWSKILKNIWFALLMVWCALFIAHVSFQLFALSYPSLNELWAYKFFDLGLEGNLPTFFSGFLFIILAISSWFCGVFDRYKGLAKKEWLPWMLVSSLLLFISLDEFTQIHEQFADPTRELLGTSGFLFFAWVIPYVLALILLSIYFLPFVLKLSRNAKLLILFGAGMFVFGAVGLEMVGARLYEAGAGNSVNYKIVSSFEELFEVLGILTALKGMFQEVILRVKSNKAD